MNLQTYLCTAVAVVGMSIPLSASSVIELVGQTAYSGKISTLLVLPDGTPAEFDRRGRRPRIPGGSGCDDPHDIAEHPECKG